MADAAKPDAYGVHSAADAFAGAAFFVAQQDEASNLAALPGLAEKYYAAMAERARKVLATPIVKGLMHS
jgi:hypothetical protein